MPDKYSPTQVATRIAAYFYLLTSLAVFPAILMAAQDLPSLPRLTYSRYLEHVNLTHVPFEGIFLGVCFILIFLVPLWRVLSDELEPKTIVVCSVIAIVVYAVSVFVAGHVYPIAAYRSRSICADGYQICYPFGVYGYLMLLALTTGIAVARATRGTSGSSMYTPPDQPEIR